MHRRTLLIAMCGLAAGLLAACGGGGGGGGGGGSATVTGTVLEVESNQPPATPATVSIAGHSVTTAADGTFTLSGLPAGLVNVTVSAQGANTRTFHAKLVANQTNGLGNIFLNTPATTGGYTANVTGRVVSQTNGQTVPVGGATVTIAGAQATTAADGTFSIANLPVGLAGASNLAVGQISANGYTTTPIFFQFALAAGNNNLGDLQIGAPIGNTPNPPYDITGKVTIAGQPASGVTMTIAGNGTNEPATTSDANGNYFFWVPAGSYTITATIAATGESAQTTVVVASQAVPVTAPVINLP